MRCTDATIDVKIYDRRLQLGHAMRLDSRLNEAKSLLTFF